MLWLWLLPLLLDCRGFLQLRRLRGPRHVRPLYVVARPLRLWARDGRTALLLLLLLLHLRWWWWWSGPLGALRRSILWRSALFRPRRRGRFLHYLLLIMLPHHVVTRLVTVILGLKRPLLFQSRIAIA